MARGDTLEAIAGLAERQGLFVVSDEANEHVIVDANKHISLGSRLATLAAARAA